MLVKYVSLLLFGWRTLKGRVGTSPVQLTQLHSERRKLPLVVGSALIISLNQDPVLSQVVGIKPY